MSLSVIKPQDVKNKKKEITATDPGKGGGGDERGRERGTKKRKKPIILVKNINSKLWYQEATARTFCYNAVRAQRGVFVYVLLEMHLETYNTKQGEIKRYLGAKSPP